MLLSEISRGSHSLMSLYYIHAYVNIYIPKKSSIKEYTISIIWLLKTYKYGLHLSRIVRKPDFCLGENKGADQLRGNREADQRL